MVAPPLVVSVPRSGFSLLISIIAEIYKTANTFPESTTKALILRPLLELLSQYITQQYTQTFTQFGLSDRLIFNGEFHLLVGGPKWLSKDNPNNLCIRKYIGVKGMGDFLLVTSHPRSAFEYYSILHSHTAPGLWLDQEHYDSYQKFSTVRNPIGIVNSASFSLNAMASEYVQRFAPQEDEDQIRQRLALYKLTDLTFFRGLVKFLRDYLDEFLAVRDRYFVMRWEDLIQFPARTIQTIAAEIGISLSQEEAEAIWHPLDHRNLMLYHKHNYRRGKGIVGDWKNSLVNEHMAVFHEFDFNRYLEQLGYDPIPELNPRDYSPYQTLIARHLQRHEIFHNVGDPDLFGFAFNKSNIDASKFNFKSFPKKKWTHVERSTLTDDAVVEAVSEVAEAACEQINGIILEVDQADLSDNHQVRLLIDSLHQTCQRLLWSCDSDALKQRHHQTFQALQAQFA